MKSKNILIAAGFGVAAYLFFLVSLTPASWLAWTIRQQSTVALSLSQTQGTIWSGKGRLGFAAKPGQPIDLGLVRWRLSPWRLLTGAIKLDIEAQSSVHQSGATITLRRGQIKLSNTSIQFSAELIKNLYPPAALIAPSGQIYISGENLLIQPGGIKGKVQVEWRGASSALLGSQPFGDYQLVVTGKISGLQLNIVTLKGDLELTASGNWDVLGSGALRLSGTARARRGSQQFEPLLVLLGKNHGNGLRKFNMNLRLPINIKAIPGFQ